MRPGQSFDEETTMRAEYWAPARRAVSASVAAVLVLLCSPGATVSSGWSASAAEPEYGTVTRLARGASSDPSYRAPVRALQRRLQSLGQPPGPVDGLFGPMTEAAVVRFQLAS